MASLRGNLKEQCRKFTCASWTDNLTGIGNFWLNGQYIGVKPYIGMNNSEAAGPIKLTRRLQL